MTEFPEMYLINLDRSHERLRLFHERNGHLKNVIRFPAVDGSELDRDALARSGFIDANLSFYSPGAIGCAMSHVRLWMMAAAQDRALTVFEDDIVVSYYFEDKIASILQTVSSDWEIIHWGCILNPLYGWVDIGTTKLKLEGYGQKKKLDTEALARFQSEKTHPGFVKLMHCFGTQGYSISPKGARAALKYCLPLRNRYIDFPEARVTTQDVGIDVALCGLYPNIAAYLCLPRLVVHADDEDSARKTIDAELNHEQGDSPF